MRGLSKTTEPDCKRLNRPSRPAQWRGDEFLPRWAHNVATNNCSYTAYGDPKDATISPNWACRRDDTHDWHRGPCRRRAGASRGGPVQVPAGIKFPFGPGCALRPQVLSDQTAHDKALPANFPDKFAWKLFLEVNKKAEHQSTIGGQADNLLSNDALWKTWADDTLTFPGNLQTYFIWAIPFKAKSIKSGSKP